MLSCAECRSAPRHEGAAACEQCGTSLLTDSGFKRGRQDRRFCSGRCRVAAHRDRKAA